MSKPSSYALLPVAVLAMTLALSGCGKPKSERKLDQLDNALLSNQSDAARGSALGGQIVVDPAKTAGTGKTPAPAAATAMPKHPAPPRLPMPARHAKPAAPGDFATTPPPALPPKPAGPTLGQLAATQSKTSSAAKGTTRPRPADVGPVSGDCYANLAYGKGWAARLPAALPLYPGAHLVEAAGNEKRGCAVRIVSFTARAPWRTVSRWYRDRAARAGWSADETMRGGDHVVAGTAADGSAFYITLTPAGGSTATDMIVSLAH